MLVHLKEKGKVLHFHFLILQNQTNHFVMVYFISTIHKCLNCIIYLNIHFIVFYNIFQIPYGYVFFLFDFIINTNTHQLCILLKTIILLSMIYLFNLFQSRFNIILFQDNIHQYYTLSPGFLMSYVFQAL